MTVWSLGIAGLIYSGEKVFAFLDTWEKLGNITNMRWDDTTAIVIKVYANNLYTFILSALMLKVMFYFSDIFGVYCVQRKEEDHVK